MPDNMSMQSLIELARVLGLPGVMLVLWYWDSRRQDARAAKAEENMRTQVAKADENMREMRHMYENNVRLVETTQEIARTTQDMATAQQSLIAMVTQQVTRLCERIDNNRYCPLAQRPGVVAPRGQEARHD